MCAPGRIGLGPRAVRVAPEETALEGPPAARQGRCSTLAQPRRRRRRCNVAVDPRDLIALEVDHDMAAPWCLQALRLQVIVVIPARVVEAAGDHRRAEQIAHLAVRHADLHLAYGCRIQIISLLDRYAINAAAQGPDGHK